MLAEEFLKKKNETNYFTITYLLGAATYVSIPAF